jgi:NADH dehydrogenase FAD-containing subunit
MRELSVLPGFLYSSLVFPGEKAMAVKELVLIGGGHAHMVTLAKLHTFIQKGFRVTVIQPSEHHYYSGMGPGMLGGTYPPSYIRFATRKVVEGQGARFVLAKAKAIDPVTQLVFLEDSDEKIPYDVLSCNAGSQVPREHIADGATVFTAKPIEGLLQAQQEIVRRSKERSLEIAVVGGGPSAVEIAGNVWQLTRRDGLHAPAIRIFAGRALLGNLPPRIGKVVRRVFQRRNIELLEGTYVKEMGQGSVLLEDGRSLSADLLFGAIGVKPSPIFSRSGMAVGPDGGLLVNENLQATEHANIFGGGDCIHFAPQPLDKVGVYAVRQNPVLYHNLMATLSGRPPQAFDPGGKYLLIYNLGGGVGIFYKWSLMFSGRLAFWIKDFIDRKFIREFQALEK